jgi:hypothetical protein
VKSFIKLPAAVAFFGLERLLLVVAIAAGLWLSAGSIWQLLIPAAPSLIPGFDPQPQRLAQDIASRRLFGEAAATPLPGTSPATSASGDIVLRGVIAGGRGQKKGLAIVVVANQPASTVIEGAEISPGIILEKVFSTRIEISRLGIKETVPLKTSAGPTK